MPPTTLLHVDPSHGPDEVKEFMKEYRGLEVAFWLPNLISYARIALLVYAMLQEKANPVAAFCALVANLVLDAVDGSVARRLQQTSAFGAFLDVWVDNLTRAYLWLTGLPLVWALPMVTLESTAFLCTHCAGGAAWKTGAFRGAPAWMRRCMSNNFRSLDGAFTVLGLMLCPLWFWANARLSTHGYTNPLALALILPGRLKALNLEVWVIFRYIHALMEQSVVRPAGSAAATGDAAGAAAQPAQAASEGRRLGVGATQLAEATSTLVKTQVTRLLKESLSKGQLSKIQVDAVWATFQTLWTEETEEGVRRSLEQLGASSSSAPEERKKQK